MDGKIFLANQPLDPLLDTSRFKICISGNDWIKFSLTDMIRASLNEAERRFGNTKHVY